MPTTIYDIESESFQNYMDREFGDISQIALDYAKLRYGIEEVRGNQEDLQEILPEKGLERSEFFETVKTEIDELLSG